jgi:multicomponent Na+:H+ antiporter subunit B
MSSLILRTAARLLVALMLLFSVFVMLRGHNEPGGGFIGGLIAATAFALYVMAEGAGAVRAVLRVDPRKVAGFGLACALAAGLIAVVAGDPFLRGLWIELPSGKVGTPLLFDLGVYLVVLGGVVALVLALEEQR